MDGHRAFLRLGIRFLPVGFVLRTGNKSSVILCQNNRLEDVLWILRLKIYLKHIKGRRL